MSLRNGVHVDSPIWTVYTLTNGYSYSLTKLLRTALSAAPAEKRPVRALRYKTGRPGEDAMKLFRTKVWPWFDIALLKWSCILAGMIAGAYCANFTKRHLLFIAAAALLMAIRPAVSYFRNGPSGRGH